MPSKRPPSAASSDARLAQWLHPGCLACATALAVAAPLVPSERTELTGAALPQAMLWFLLALAYFAGTWLTRQTIRRLLWVDYAALALGGWLAFSGFVMMKFGAPRPTINLLWTWLSLLTAFLLLRQLLRGQCESRAICAVMIGVAVCLSVVAIQQTFVAYPAMRALYERDPEEALRQAGITAPPGTAQRKQFEDRLNSTEPNATFSLTNSLAGFIAPWLVLLVAVASSRRVFAAGRTRGLEALTTGAIAVPLVICLLLTKSRSAWLATLLGLAAVAIIKTIAGGQRPATSQRLAIVAVASLVLLVSAVLAAIGIFDIDIVAQAGRSLAFRLEYWQATLAMIADHPLLGIGFGNFQEYYTTYKFPQASETIADPHNFLLEIAANAGVPALVAFAVLLILCARRPRVLMPETGKRDAYPTATVAIYVGGLVGVPLAIVLGLVTGYLPDIEPLLLGAILGTTAVWLLRGWVDGGTLPSWLIVVAIGVLLVNLLAAGGISFPGVAITLWILLAILVAGGQRPAGDSVNAHGTPAGRWPPAMGAVVAAALLAACYVTAYRPVLTRTRLSLAVSDAQTAGRIDEAIGFAKAAAAADPWSADPHLQLTQLYHERWQSQAGQLTNDDADFQAFRRHSLAALARNPRAFPLWAAVAFIQWEACQRTGEPGGMQVATMLLAHSVELYPNDALGRAQLAWLFDQTGQNDEAQREAAEALRLDALCPHAERKLAQRRLFAEVTSEAQQARMPAELRTLDAEQWMHRLRKK